MKIGDTVIEDSHGNEIKLSDGEMRELYLKLNERYGTKEYYPYPIYPSPIYPNPIEPYRWYTSCTTDNWFVNTNEGSELLNYGAKQ